MDSFSIIQSFFARMTCNYCNQPFDPNGIELLREEFGVHFVNVRCNACNRQIGVAMVGVELQDQGQAPHGQHDHGPVMTDGDMNGGGTRVRIRISPVSEGDEDGMEEIFGTRYIDPELTPDELERLADYQPIGYDDVLDAHHFFSTLDRDWQKYLPPEIVHPSDNALEAALDEDESALLR